MLLNSEFHVLNDRTKIEKTDRELADRVSDPINNIGDISFNFNLELLEDNFEYELLETESPVKTDECTRDILSDAVSHIIDQEAPIDHHNHQHQIEKQSKTVEKGGKRGRKLGYRSENSNGENTVCGVCGAKVSRGVIVYRNLKSF